ncbi:MAG: hypothetical protein H0X33_14005 [Taibaiella sp.]|nr:hypothetical protein [Taibaiella sp.]
MKKLATILALLPTLAFGQQYELGLSAGVSINSKPTNNMYFKGDVITPNYAADVTLLRNFGDDFQIGIDIHEMELSRRSHIVYDDYGHLIGADNKKFVYAKFASSICIVLNKKIYLDDNYFYGGIAMGGAIARNNSHKLSGDAAYEAPDGGYGLSMGIQVGYVYNFCQRFALCGELASRYMDLDYDAHAPITLPATNLHYRMIAYSATIGFRYRFGYNRKLDATTGESLLVK